MSHAVVVGSGSAGRRHAAALSAQDPDRVVVMVRRAQSTTDLDELRALGVEVVDDLEDALGHAPTLGVVATAAPFHATATLRLLDAGCHVLVEKPLSHSLSQEATAELLARTELHHRVVVGYHLRFGDVAPRLRELVARGEIGAPLAAHLEVGQQLSEWRPGVEPRDSVTAREELGGGVLLELSHELDALRHVLDTELDQVAAARLRHDGAPTDGRVDTVADLDLRTREGLGCTVHLDMVSVRPVRRWRVVGSEGTLEADLLGSTIMVERRDGRRGTVAAFPAGERDRAEARLIDHLAQMSRNGIAPACTIADGAAALAAVEAARASAASGHAEPILALHGSRR